MWTFNSLRNFYFVGDIWDRALKVLYTHICIYSILIHIKVFICISLADLFFEIVFVGGVVFFFFFFLLFFSIHGCKVHRSICGPSILYVLFSEQYLGQWA